MSIKSVEKSSESKVPYKHIKEFTLERNPIDVTIVVKPSIIPLLYEIMKELIPKKKSMNTLRNVGEPFVKM